MLIDLSVNREAERRPVHSKGLGASSRKDGYLERNSYIKCSLHDVSKGIEMKFIMEMFICS